MYNPIRTLCALACFAGFADCALAVPIQLEPLAGKQALPPHGYSTPRQMARELQTLADQSAKLSLQEVGKAPSGAPLLVATWAGANANGPEVWILANLEGDRLVASEVAMGVIRHLAAGGSPLLDAATVHVLPVANPDGATHALESGFAWRGAAVDEDRDGRLDEDGPMDLDGDGRSLWMRVPSSAGEYHASESDPRCSVKAKDVREKAAAFHLRREGRDVDGDRLFTEDGPGGIRVDANFAHRWEQYAPSAGPYPLSEPESRALADFLIQHPRIACVLVLDDEDNLSEPPAGGDEVKPDSTEPLKADAALVAVLGKRLKPVEEEPPAEVESEDSDAFSLETMKEAEQEAKDGSEPQHLSSQPDRVEVESTDVNQEDAQPTWTAPLTAEHGKGNFADWAYFQRGVFVLESAVWSPPMDSKNAEGKDLPKEATDEEHFLAWADSVYGPACFQPWTAFQDEELGSVEIGGILPLIQSNPPATELPELIKRYADFVDGLAQDFAQIEWSEVSYKALDARNVFEIRAKLVNRGRFASIPNMGIKNRIPLPIRISLELPEGAQLLVGQAKSSVGQLTGFGGYEDFHWIVRVPSGTPILNALSNTAGQARLTLEVK